MSSDTLAELFARDPKEAPHTPEEIEKIIAYYRAKRKEFMADPKPATAASRAKKESKIDLNSLLDGEL